MNGQDRLGVVSRDRGPDQIFGQFKLGPPSLAPGRSQLEG